jgi:F-type H+-transporting ATPase subunit epsilon
VADGRVADKVNFQLVAPERLLVAAEVDMVVVPGAEGDFGVLPLHSPFMSVLRPGVIETYEGNQVIGRIFVGGGFAEVNERGCTVLAEEAMPVEELDVEQARQRLADAQEDLRELADEVARARLEHAIRVAEAQIQAAAG